MWRRDLNNNPFHNQKPSRNTKAQIPQIINREHLEIKLFVPLIKLIWYVTSIFPHVHH